MEEQVKVTFLIDKEVLEDIALDAAAKREELLQGLSIVGLAMIVANNDEEVNTIDLDEIKDKHLLEGFVAMSSAFLSEKLKMKGEDYFQNHIKRWKVQ